MKKILASVLIVTACAFPAAAAEIVSCDNVTDAGALMGSALNTPSLQAEADDSAFLSVLEPLIAAGACHMQVYPDSDIGLLEQAARTAHREGGASFGLVELDGRYVVASHLHFMNF
ncbi:hypothetical protein KC722_02080 [Candidatus Kaiserbacteria bacterium]|nr:hypothetical protein [Candidatus Kaiserbacteria bacterium]MCB9811545.1 hypothetical protein [Candidatus Nomurabacteria bacterium]